MYKYIFFSILLIGCSSLKNSQFILSPDKVFSKKIPLNMDEQKKWQHMDLYQDTIPGISLDKMYQDLLKNNKGVDVIVAIIDTELDINHEDLKTVIWTNQKEIFNNGIDDDKNSYIDDYHGWNFLGNLKGENVIYGNMESIRIIRKFKAEFEGKTQESISTNRLSDYLVFQTALKVRERANNDFVKDSIYINRAAKGYYTSLEVAQKYIPSGDYTNQKLDSLMNVFKDDKELHRKFDNMKDVIKYNVSDKWISDYRKGVAEKFKSINLDYNDRELIGDNPENLSDKNYGNNNVSENSRVLYHSTEVAGLLASNRENAIGIKGISNKIKVMPLALSSYGDEHDKDIALAIRYAVDNGAKVINMSFGKLLSMHHDWVLDAIRYAEEKDVLIVSSAGNGGMEVKLENMYYPNNRNISGKEVSSNFIKVGATTSFADEKLVASFSNYSKEFVDVFAPGAKIYTTFPDNNYKFDSGTSLAAPIVSGIAALIRSHYPKLTAAQVKQIILESGVSYDIEVQVPGEKKGVTKPFKELSKSGKVVNAYNAMLMAKQVSKGKLKLGVKS